MKTRTPKQNKSDLLKSFLQSETDLTPHINEAIFNRFFDLLEINLKKHLTIELRNFGVFKSKLMPSRYGSDPRNKAKIFIKKEDLDLAKMLFGDIKKVSFIENKNKNIST